jgi:hypothetical protein
VTWLTRFRIHRIPALRDGLLARLLHADNGLKRIVRTLVDLEDVLHLPDELGISVGQDALHLGQPRLQLVFFESPTDCLIRDISDMAELDQFVR